ncbi:MAG: exosortase/archaeosortase family protein [Kiritimatiellae bacterium]|nr:exosortase/archaeosortase family protein [Kiritimatiellia bacterium]MCO5067934.1 exosortase/archaeosortase family protein [Kiritimatiellia bacterium]
MEPKIWNERWRLAQLTREDWTRIGLASLIIALVFVLFHFQGNTTDVRSFGRSALAWMIERWNDDDGTGDYSHGWLVPFVSIAVVWMKRRELAAAPKAISKVGLSLVIFALMLHWLGAKAQQTRLSLFGMLLLIWAIPFYFYGWRTAKLLIFPCSYLIFCIPLNFLDSLTFPLRLLAASLSTGFLNGVGIAAERSGSAIYSMAAGGFNFDVADPCSGIRSLLALTALTAVYAYFTQKTLIRKWILFLCAIPLAIAGNIARIVTVGIVAEAFGEKLALGLFHDYSGYVVFSVAIALMLGIGTLLNTNFQELCARWKHALLNPT